MKELERKIVCTNFATKEDLFSLGLAALKKN
jgi:hypothetical protein